MGLSLPPFPFLPPLLRLLFLSGLKSLPSPALQGKVTSRPSGNSAVEDNSVAFAVESSLVFLKCSRGSRRNTFSWKEFGWESQFVSSRESFSRTPADVTRALSSHGTRVGVRGRSVSNAQEAHATWLPAWLFALRAEVFLEPWPMQHYTRPSLFHGCES